MVRSTLLILSLEAAAAPLFGVWTRTDNTTERAPCPRLESYSERDPLRLPQGCRVERAGVWTHPSAWLEEREELARLKSLLESTTERAARAEARAEEAERALSEAHAAHTQQLEGLAKLCTPAPPPACAVWTPRAEGAALAALACTAYHIGKTQ